MAEKVKLLGAAGGAVGLGGFAAALGCAAASPGRSRFLEYRERSRLRAWHSAAFCTCRGRRVSRFRILACVSQASLRGWSVYCAAASSVAMDHVGYCGSGCCASCHGCLSASDPVAGESPCAMPKCLAGVRCAIRCAPFGIAGAGDAPAASGYAVLDDDFSQLREDFNRAKGSVRLLFVVDRICPGCLRGMDDMNKDLLSRTKDGRLKTLLCTFP